MVIGAAYSFTLWQTQQGIPWNPQPPRRVGKRIPDTGLQRYFRRQPLGDGGGGGGKKTFSLNICPNSIAFGSAPRREVDSQPISPLAKPAVNQTEAHRLGLLSVANAAPSSGEIRCLGPSSDRMVMQLTEGVFVGGSNPGRVNVAPPPPPTVGRPGFEPPTKKFGPAALPFDRQMFVSDKLPHCLEPDQKLLTPTHPPTPTPTPTQKSDIQF